MKGEIKKSVPPSFFFFFFVSQCFPKWTFFLKFFFIFRLNEGPVQSARGFEPKRKKRANKMKNATLTTDENPVKKNQ